MSKKQQTSSKQFDPAVLAVVHRTDGRWRMIVTRQDGATPTLLAHREFSDAEGTLVDGWLDRYNPAQVVCVLPAANVICRTIALPDIPVDQLDDALALQAEGHLLGIAPPHRLSMATMPAAFGERSRCGVVVAWPETSMIEIPNIDRPIVFASDVAGLAALMDTQRPSAPLVWADRSTGSIAIAMTHANGIAFRAVSEDGGDASSWAQRVSRVIAETALNANQPADAVEQATRDASLAFSRTDGSCMLMVSDEIQNTARGRLGGTPSDDASWWNTYGIAVGVALARSGSLAPLTMLLEDAPVSRQSLISRAVTAMATPQAAFRLAIIAIAVLALGPAAMAGARLLVLQMRAADLDTRMVEFENAQHQVVMYTELNRRSRPITKILADINCCTPEGVDLDSIRINSDDAFTVLGQVSPHENLFPTEIISLMSEQLQLTRIFNDVSFDIGDKSKMTNSYDFSLSARIVNPHREGRYAESQDFAIWTLEQRVNNDPAPSMLAKNGDDADASASNNENNTELASSGDPDPDPVDNNDGGDGTDGTDGTSLATAPPAQDGGLTQGAGRLGGPTGGTNASDGGSSGREGPGLQARNNSNQGNGVTSIGDHDHVPIEIPDLLTDDQIAALSEQETRKRMEDVAAARDHFNKTGEKEKADEYLKQVMAMVNHLRELKSQAGE